MGVEKGRCEKGFYGFLAALALAGCENARTVQPEESATSPIQIIPRSSICPDQCVLVSNSAPLAAAQVNPDSLSATLDLGTVTVQGEAGNSIALELRVDPNLLQSLPPETRIITRIDRAERGFLLVDLLTPRPVYTFTSTGIVIISYRLSRTFTGLPGQGAFQLIQTHSHGEVIEARLPWSGNQGRFASNLTGCNVTADSARVCGVTVVVDSFAPATPLQSSGAVFQSHPGTSASTQITIRFSTPVRAAHVVIYDPTYQGNVTTAYDTLGNPIEGYSFKYSGIPGTNIPDSTNLVPSRGIAKIILTPASADYVAYALTFDPAPCPPTEDPVLDSPEVRAGFDAAMRNSNPFAIPGSGLKTERGGLIILRPNGTFYAIEQVDPNASECGYTTQSAPPLPQGDSIVARYHTHPSLFLEPTYGCTGWAHDPADGKKPALADPNNPNKGGGSDADWDATLQGFPNWVFTKDGHLYRLEQSYYDNRSNNPFKWVEKPAAPGCFTTP